MKKILLLILVFSTTLLHNSIAQKVNGCGYIIPPKSLKSSFQSVYEAANIIKTMRDTIAWQANFKIKEQNGINNAYATIINNARWIVYDNDFLENLDSYAATKWASISVLAHEMGHHYYDHVVKSQGSTIPNEIEADKFSGYMMYMLGATEAQAKAAMEKIGTTAATATHPAKKDRLTAIANGFALAKTKKPNSGTGGNTGGNGGTGNGGTNTGGGGATNTDPNTDPSWIALSMQSTKAETVYLSDDGKTYNTAEIPAGQPFVFKFEVYNYGWLRLPYYNGYRTFKLMHGKDYTIIWNRRTKNWTVVEVPQ